MDFQNTTIMMCATKCLRPFGSLTTVFAVNFEKLIFRAAPFGRLIRVLNWGMAAWLYILLTVHSRRNILAKADWGV